MNEFIMTIHNMYIIMILKLKKVQQQRSISKRITDLIMGLGIAACIFVGGIFVLALIENNDRKTKVVDEHSIIAPMTYERQQACVKYWVSRGITDTAYLDITCHGTLPY